MRKLTVLKYMKLRKNLVFHGLLVCFTGLTVLYRQEIDAATNGVFSYVKILVFGFLIIFILKKRTECLFSPAFNPDPRQRRVLLLRYAQTLSGGNPKPSCRNRNGIRSGNVGVGLEALELETLHSSRRTALSTVYPDNNYFVWRITHLAPSPGTPNMGGSRSERNGFLSLCMGDCQLQRYTVRGN